MEVQRRTTSGCSSQRSCASAKKAAPRDLAEAEWSEREWARTA